jgi:hypothetical protein
MKVVDLQKALRGADAGAGAVLVPVRILEQIIEESCNLRGSIWSTPHRECFVVDRQTLFRHIEQAYLDLEPDQLLPETIILLPRPPAEELSDLESKSVLEKYWRRLFHASVHIALDAGHGGVADKLPSVRVQERKEEIGRAEFDEIRTILTQDKMLLPGATDREVYIEFAAVYLETRYFAGSALAAMFPALRDFVRVEQMLARDVDAATLLKSTQPEGALALTGGGDPEPEEPQSHERYSMLIRSAERAELEDNLVGAAILRIRASRIAPAALGQRTHERAIHDMKILSARLAKALHLGPAEELEWGRDLPLLLEKADQGINPSEAKLLFELQRICSEFERDLFGLDLIEWALSAGKLPIKRPLPRLRMVRITRNLQSATRHLEVVRLHDADRQHFTSLLNAALARAEQKIRDDFGKVLSAALEDVGLHPVNPPERVARSKMVAEWVDRIISHGFLTLSDLRDTIARNQLKMPDLADPRDFMRGDPLLRLDRRLASLLDGVYRPSDIYMRGLERLTALNFGTKIGRLLTLWITVPFVGAEALLQLFGILLNLFFNVQKHPAAHPNANWFYRLLIFQERYGNESAFGLHRVWHLLLWIMLASFLMALLHDGPFRERCRRGLLVVRRHLRRVFIEMPAELFRLHSWQKLLRSWQFQLARYVVKPLALVGIIWLLLPTADRLPSAALLLVLFGLSAITVNSRVGKAITEAAWEVLKTFVKLLRAGLILGLFRFIMRLFKQILDAGELVLFTVDDWLRYRKGDSVPSLVVRTVLGVLWFPVSYIVRFLMVVMIEPGFNPAKAPISLVAAKFVYPLAVAFTWQELLSGALGTVLPHWIAYGLAFSLIWLSPDIFGFLFWETKENWSMYRANRRKKLRAVPMGPHGESIKSLLTPGFHSGAIPRLYGRLRVAEQRACWTHNWAAARAIREELNEIGSAVDRFVSRELLAILEESPGWPEQCISVGKVDLSVKRIVIELLHADHVSRPARLEFELRETCLVATVRDCGWLDGMTPEQLHAFTAALASLYKLAGVNLVSEQIQANLPGAISTWTVSPKGLTLWLDQNGPPLVCYLRESDEPVHAPQAAATPPDKEVANAPAIDTGRLVFSRRPLYWDQWVANWNKPGNGKVRSTDDDWHRELLTQCPPEREAVRVNLESPTQAGAA